MKYIVIGKKSALLLVLLLVTMVLFLGFMVTRNVMQVNSAKRALPIYSVDLGDGSKKASLGINCAWGNEDISAILDVLDTYDTKATFFLVGSFCEKYPQTVEQIHQRGHELGNHSNTHPDMTKLSVEAITKEIEDCSNTIEQITGQKVNLFRAPSGGYNNRVIETVNQLGYSAIQWDCDSLDWKGTTPTQMWERISKNLKSGSILLFHNDTKHTLQALPEIIKTMQQEGYELVSVGNLIYKDNYKIDHTGRQIQNETNTQG